MKNWIILITVFVLFGCYGRKPKTISGYEGQSMPSIDLILADSISYFNTANIQKGKPTIIFSFEPWCPYCRAQTKSILRNIESLKGINIYMVCNSPYANFKKYYDEFKLEKYRITAGIDYRYTFEDYFQTSKIPYMAIYDQNKKLKKVLIGKNYINTIKEAALE